VLGEGPARSRFVSGHPTGVPLPVMSEEPAPTPDVKPTEAGGRLRADARYRALVEQLPVVVYHYTEGLPLDYVSPNIEALLGRPAEAYLADHRLWHRTIHPDDRERMEAAWWQGRETGTGYQIECRYVRPDGGIVWVRDDARVELDPGDGLPSWQGVLVDITAQKHAERDREASQRRYRALVEQVPAIVYEMGPDDERRTLFVSPHVEEILGYSRQEWLDQPDIWIELLHPEDRETELAALDLHNETGAPWDREYRLIASDGSVVWLRDKAVLVPDLPGGGSTWHGVMLDITDRKELEERLQLMNDELEVRVGERTTELAEANEMMGLEIGERRRIESELRVAREGYRRLVEDLPAVVYLWDMVHQREELDRDAGRGRGYTSPRVHDLLGYSASEWSLPGFWQTRLHPHDRDRILDLVERFRRTGEPFNAEYRFLAKDGRVVWVVDRATVLERDAAGLPSLFQGVLLDITDRREAEQAENWYMRLTQESPGIVWVVSERDEDPHVRWQHYFVNAREQDLLGYQLEEFAGPALWRSYVHPDDRERVVQENEHIWRTGAPWNTDFRMIAKDGRVIWFHLDGRTVEFDENGRPCIYQGLMSDIDVRKGREEELQATVERQRSLLDGMPAMPWTEEWDPATGSGRLVHLGPQAQEILGWPSQDLGNNSYEHMARFLHPDDRQRIERSFQRGLAEGARWEETYRIVARDGTVRRIRSTGQRVSPPDVIPQIWQGVAVVLAVEGTLTPSPDDTPDRNALLNPES
jgi:adenylate cyclase